MENIELPDIESAYRKLKGYYYYDNTLLNVRAQIAMFESGGINVVKKKLKKIHKALNARSPSGTKYLKNLYDKINILVTPKSYKSNKKNDDSEGFILSNKASIQPFHVNRVNYFIDAPIELHIISVLWILKEGYCLQESYQRYNYGYQISLKDGKQGVVDGLQLFHRYFEQYQRWRDKSIDTAKKLLEMKQDATIIQMDVKGYFHNVSLDFTKLIKEIKEKTNSNAVLTKILQNIYKNYFEKLRIITDEFVQHSNNTTPLPIGMLSSGVLGNWFLSDFDKKVVKNLSPAFYGRYVDDIIIVMANTPLYSSEKYNTYYKWYLHKYFEERKILERNEKNNDSFLILYDSSKDSKESIKNPLEIQKEKLSILEFSHTESHAALNNFIVQLKENSSIFWMLPDDKKDSKDFDRSANDLIYNDTHNKLRSLRDISPSKFGASVFLAKKILSSLLSDEKATKETDKQILTFFKGKYALEFYTVWEKVASYFVINEKQNEFFKFYKTCFETINSIDNKYNKFDVETIVKIKFFLHNHLKSAICLAVSLNPPFLLNEESKLSNRLQEQNLLKNIGEYKELIDAYRKSNMIRHNYVTIPLFNYTKYSMSREQDGMLPSLLVKNEIELLNKLEDNDLNFHSDFFSFSPRYVRLSEVNLHSFYKFLIGSSKTTEQEFSSKNLTNEVITGSFKEFYQINQIGSIQTKHSITKNWLKEIIISAQNDHHSKVEIKQTGLDISKIKIAVGNHRINKSDIEPSVKNKLLFTTEKKNNLIRIVNQAEEEKADFLLLPEITIPFKWLIRIADESRRKSRVIIGGIEHFSISHVCYNYMVTILPISINGIQESLVIPRLKNHYSPEEVLLINNIRYSVPQINEYFYHIFKWRGVRFSTFNCYELADIHHRALMKSKVDIIFASEYNKDWKYFSNIAESITRDIHCYYVQSNTSDIGDSRIIQPTNSERKDILRLKGGQRSSVLVGLLDVKKLRIFQEKEYYGQKELGTFKPTPPDFNKDEINE